MILKILGGIYLLGLVGMFVGWAWLRRRAFAEGIGWGLLCAFVPGGSLVFLWRRWDDARDPVIASALGFAAVLPLVLSNPVRFAQNVSAAMTRDGWRGALIGSAFPPEPAVSTVRRDPWPFPVENEEETDPAADATPTPAGPSDAFEREAAIADHLEQREREARAAFARRRAEADTLYQDLSARRARLKAEDARAVAAFNADAARYAALLEQMRLERVTLDQGNPVLSPPDPAATSPVPRPGVVRRANSTGAVARTPPGVATTLTVLATPSRTGQPTSSPPGSPSDPYLASLNAARAARDAASQAEEAGPWAADVYGTGAAPVTPSPAPSPRR